MVATFALLMAAATAAPLLDVFADPCSGSGELKTDMVGKCYSGGATVLTVSELAVLQIKSYDTATGEGTMRLDTEGVSTIHCPPANFKKVDKAITVDLSACGKIHKALASAEAKLNEFLKKMRFLKGSENVDNPRFTPERTLLYDFWFAVRLFKV